MSRFTMQTQTTALHSQGSPTENLKGFPTKSRKMESNMLFKKNQLMSSSMDFLQLVLWVQNLSTQSPLLQHFQCLSRT